MLCAARPATTTAATAAAMRPRTAGSAERVDFGASGSVIITTSRRLSQSIAPDSHEAARRAGSPSTSRAGHQRGQRAVTAARDRRTRALRPSDGSRPQRLAPRDSNDSVALRLFPALSDLVDGKVIDVAARPPRCNGGSATNRAINGPSRSALESRPRAPPAQSAAHGRRDGMVDQFVASDCERQGSTNTVVSPSCARTSAAVYTSWARSSASDESPPRRETGNGAQPRPSRRNSRGTHPRSPQRRSRSTRHTHHTQKSFDDAVLRPRQKCETLPGPGFRTRTRLHSSRDRGRIATDARGIRGRPPDLLRRGVVSVL
jgi:hypothetical protein